MGIKHFFSYFRNQFPRDIMKLRRNQNFTDINVEIDNMMIDMNGVIHSSAQKIYEYGNNKPNPRFLKNKKPRTYGLSHQKKLFEDICLTVERLFLLTNPKKRLILCIDGPAPKSKQSQQRQRRFKSASEKTEEEMIGHFDANCITPGTKFMDYLSKYIDRFIKQRISEDIRWQNIEVVFSSEKAPGEGEQKAISYIRYYGEEGDSYCIHGLDADLIMLTLSTHIRDFYILRDDLYDYNNEFLCIRISTVREQLIEILRWKSEKFTFDPETSINDFVFLCFMVGNDFLPHIPSLEIIENGIDIILDVYRDVGRSYGHITRKVGGKVQFIHESLEVFLGTISHFEKKILEDKLNKKKVYFADLLLESCATLNKGKYELDIERYREAYCEEHFPEEIGIEKICHDYFEGLQWVISYYTKGVPNWKWQFPYNYAPSASILAQHLSTFVCPTYGRTIPFLPYQLLLSVLPPKSSNLIPEPLNLLLTDDNSPLKPFCPDIFDVDLAGKRKEWEGIVILPIMDTEIMRTSYFEKIGDVDQRDLKRNVTGRSYVYMYTPTSKGMFKSYYGDIQETYVNVFAIDL